MRDWYFNIDTYLYYKNVIDMSIEDIVKMNGMVKKQFFLLCKISKNKKHNHYNSAIIMIKKKNIDF